MLRFSIAGFPIEIHPTFLILGLFVLDAGFGVLGVGMWMAAVVVSILVHELGHAFVARWAGGQVQQVMLYGMGGVTIWTDAQSRVDWWRRMLVSVAGSGAGFVVGGLTFLAVSSGALGELAQEAIVVPWDVALGLWVRLEQWGVFFAAAIIWTSTVWGALNLLPIGGLDGSHILGAVLERILGDRGRFHAAVIGLAVAVVAAAWLFQRGLRFAPLIFLYFAMNDFRRVQGRS